MSTDTTTAVDTPQQSAKTPPRMKVRYREEIAPALQQEFSIPNVMLVEGEGVTRIAYKRVDVTKRRPDGSEYPSTRSVRISRKTGKEI
jgi:hypothetical protein